MYNADEFRWKLHAIVGVARLLNFMIELTVSLSEQHKQFFQQCKSSILVTRILGFSLLLLILLTLL